MEWGSSESAMGHGGARTYMNMYIYVHLPTYNEYQDVHNNDLSAYTAYMYNYVYVNNYSLGMSEIYVQDILCITAVLLH